MKQIRASAAAFRPTSRVDNMVRWLRCTLLWLRCTVLCLLAAPLTVSPGFAAYPTRAITVIVPFATGGPSDTVARIIGGHLSMTLGQQLIIENVVGSGGATAAIRAMRAPADGYTLIMGQMGTHGSAPAVHPNLPYNPAKDFAPVGLVLEIPVVVIARNPLPVHTVAELISHVRTHPDTTMGHAGAGSISHAACTLLEATTHVHATAKPFQGSGPGLQAMLEGRVDYMCDQIVNSIDRIRAGEVRALVIAADRRSPALPDVPTAAEAGIPAFDVSAWQALFAPKNTPPELIERLATALDQALDDPTVRQELTALAGTIPAPDERGPAALRRLVDDEIARWKKHLKPALARDDERMAP
ncbi:tripartite tricarboxylate transporter substrate-binding protein [Rhodopseudomonas telluris]|uniref:Tripartite tricarboxylate transporter substrate-binding protein n=1 Tax=Rhodopseudomonas telluris TaxID=644215 RepID=A0ABV6EP95_9BRAD